MKFAEHLSAHITPEWRKQYINYEEMKTMLYSAVEEAPPMEGGIGSRTRFLANFDETFFHYCENELAKINTFYSEKVAEATRKYAALQSELSEALERSREAVEGKNQKEHRRRFLPRDRAPARKLRDLKLAYSEFYLSLVLLQNYQNLNFTGFRKILKKRDKLLSGDCGSKWREDKVETSHFYTNKEIDRMISSTEAAVTRELEAGDRQRAMQRLRVPPLGHRSGPWTTFRVGLFSGAFVTLAVAVAICGTLRMSNQEWRIALRLFRGPLLLAQFLLLWAVNVHGWRASGVNHVLIFDLDPRRHLGEQDAAELAAALGVLWASAALAFLYR